MTPADGALELMLVTDGVGDRERIARLVRRAVRGGLRCVQLREPRWSGRDYAAACDLLRPILEQVQGVLLTNDRADCAAAGLAHGVHVPGHGLPIEAARRAVGGGRLCGTAAHSEADLQAAAAAKLDYATLSPVFATTSKPGAQPLGIEPATEWSAAVSLPVLWLGGVDAATAVGLRARGAAGVAVRSALCEAADPGAAAREILAAFRR